MARKHGAVDELTQRVADGFARLYTALDELTRRRDELVVPLSAEETAAIEEGLRSRVRALKPDDWRKRKTALRARKSGG